MRRKLDVVVRSGEYESLTDVVEDALHYWLNRYEIRRDLLTAVVDEVDVRMETRIRTLLYSPENKKFLLTIVEEVQQEISQKARGE